MSFLFWASWLFIFKAILSMTRCNMNKAQRVEKEADEKELPLGQQLLWTSSEWTSDPLSFLPSSSWANSPPFFPLPPHPLLHLIQDHHHPLHPHRCHHHHHCLHPHHPLCPFPHHCWLLYHLPFPRHRHCHLSPCFVEMKPSPLEMGNTQSCTYGRHRKQIVSDGQSTVSLISGWNALYQHQTLLRKIN